MRSRSPSWTLLDSRGVVPGPHVNERGAKGQRAKLLCVCVFFLGVKGAEQEKSGVHEIFSIMSGVKTVSSCATG